MTAPSPHTELTLPLLLLSLPAYPFIISPLVCLSYLGMEAHLWRDRAEEPKDKLGQTPWLKKLLFELKKVQFSLLNSGSAFKSVVCLFRERD